MKNKDRKTGEVCILCPKLLVKEKRKEEKAKQKELRAKIAQIEKEEKEKIEPKIVVPEVKIDYWNDTRFEPIIPPMHCPFSAVCY
tara:strand:+ start:197 stop:451 length:255 start_codon:yes stop_codon:yes gene_type:complete